MNFELTKKFLESLRIAIEKNDEKFVLEHIFELHPADIAEILDELTPEEGKLLFHQFDEEKAADVLVELEEDVREKFLASLSSKEIAEQFIDNLESDDAADVIGELPEDVKEEVISHLEDVDQASDIVDLLNYEEGTAGALMGKEMIAVQENWTIMRCTKEMRKQAEEIDFVYTVYVVTEKSKLIGTLSLKRMLLTPAKSKITDIYNSEVISIRATAKDEEVAQIMQKYDLIALPVIDELGRLIGRITIDDVVDVIQEESEKDYQMASGISEDVESSDKVWVLTRARLPWLLIGLLGGIFGAQVIALYETDLGIHPEMAFFIPLIAAMGGNVGVQSSAIIVQGLANNSLGFTGITSRLYKEFLVGLLNGLICSALILMYNMVFSDSMELSYTVSAALLVVIIFAALFGTFIPLILDKYKIDPALATGPFITTLNDILGLFIYFYIGSLMY
ncbi:MAG: magnesium transporter [Flavobacteriales bacterium]|nr:magnesium transporter [Flavobacteriales bacterium]